MKYAEYVKAMALAIREAARLASREGVTAMSRDNLRQVTRFPPGAANANMAARAFDEALSGLSGKLGLKVTEYIADDERTV